MPDIATISPLNPHPRYIGPPTVVMYFDRSFPGIFPWFGENEAKLGTLLPLTYTNLMRVMYFDRTFPGIFLGFG